MTRGFLGVDLFFVISGFLIVSLLLRERRRTGTISLRAFYARRLLRIFPLYYGVLGSLTILYALFSHSGWPAFRHDAVIASLYLSNWLPTGSLLAITWSLATEEQFYMAWPFLEKVSGRAITYVLGSALAIFAGLQLVHAHTDLLPNLSPFLAQTSFTPIVLGVVLAHTLDSAGGYRLVGRLFGHALAAPIALAITAGMVCFLPQDDISGWPRLAIHLSMVALLGCCVVREDHRLASILRWRPLARIGVVSYGIYLLHHIAHHLTSKITATDGLTGGYAQFLMTIGLTWLMAEVSFRFYETPFLKLKERWGR